MTIYAVGSGGKSAEQFFETLKSRGIKRLVDVRLRNTSQLAGFSKKNDLRYFLRALCGAEYVHLPCLAPTEELLRAFKEHEIAWCDYENGFLELLARRNAIAQVDPSLFHAPAVLLCSEALPEHCHRRLVAERLCMEWGDADIVHL